MGRSIQLDGNGGLRHFLSIEGLNRTLLTEILDTAENFISVGNLRPRREAPLRRCSQHQHQHLGNHQGGDPARYPAEPGGDAD